MVGIAELVVSPKIKKMMTTVEKYPHHEQQELCTTRPLYRQGRKLTAVKVILVYTVVSESAHLIVSGVPDLRLREELWNCAAKFGDILCLSQVDGFTEEQFTVAFHLLYARIQSARFAKKKLDGLSFFGGILHVCYAPELETIVEVQTKLKQRVRDVETRRNRDNRLQHHTFKNRKRKPGQESRNESQSFNTLVGPKRRQHSSPVSPSVLIGPEMPPSVKQTRSVSQTGRNVAGTSNNFRFIPHRVQNNIGKSNQHTNKNSVEQHNALPSSSGVIFRKTEASVSSSVSATRERIRTICTQKLGTIVFKKPH
ncbi:hypothetical protein B566_EDAN010778 [Ephemera danica]|nr:hypothetical protein B566_EDAN010778 [Ephemera danica]